MNYAKSNPIGMDAAIHQLQAKLHTKLASQWELEDAKIAAFPRVYRNITDKGYEPQFKYQGVGEDNPEYKNMFGDDHFDAMFFFGTGERATVTPGNDSQVDVHVIFRVNLDMLATTSGLTHRGDMEAIQDVEKLLSGSNYGFTLKGWCMGLDKVFAEYSAWRQTSIGNLEPWLYFRFDLSLRFDAAECIRTPISVVTGYPCN